MSVAGITGIGLDVGIGGAVIVDDGGGCGCGYYSVIFVVLRFAVW